MPNSAHIMLLKFNSEWLIAMDLIYEKNKINSKMNSARDYLDSAQTNFTKKQWSPFITSIWKANELLALSLLLMHYQGPFSLRQQHNKTRQRFHTLCTTGRLSSEFGNHYDDVYRRQKQGSYSQGISGNYTIEKGVAQNLLDRTNNLFEITKQILEEVDQNRKPINLQIRGDV